MDDLRIDRPTSHLINCDQLEIVSKHNGETKDSNFKVKRLRTHQVRHHDRSPVKLNANTNYYIQTRMWLTAL